MENNKKTKSKKYEPTQTSNKPKSFRVDSARFARSTKTTNQIQKIPSNPNFEPTQNSKKPRSFQVDSTCFARTAKTTNQIQKICYFVPCRVLFLYNVILTFVILQLYFFFFLLVILQACVILAWYRDKYV